MIYFNFLLLQSLATKWVGFILHQGLSIQQQKVFKVSIFKMALPSDLAIFFFLPSCPWCLAYGMCSVLLSVPGIYIETYIYDDVYVQLPMTSYLHQNFHHVRQPYIRSSGSTISFPHDFTKNIFFQKFDLFLKQLGQIFLNSQ